MRMVVCIKQVPDTTEVEIDPERGTLIREGIPVTINPFDLYAIEEALRLRERLGGEVLAISMGPPQAESSLRDAIALGCDRAILLSDPVFAGADTLATSYTLSRAISKIGSYDLILCGLKTTDGDTGQVGPGLAEELGIPHSSYVRKIVDFTGEELIVERTLDETCQTVVLPLPCLITVTKEINEPRLPSFKGKMAARKAEIPVWSSKDLEGEKERFGADGSPTSVVKVFHPTTQRNPEFIEGDPSRQAETLLERLRERQIV
ncbi:MAG: electron transfer flavoprotein subunit beta/FixA family protein [Candidatus Thorarchaeota archaeon]